MINSFLLLGYEVLEGKGNGECAMKANRKEVLRDIREIRRRLSLVEKKAAALNGDKKISPKKAFQRKFPGLDVNPDLFKWVGIDPPLSIRREKEAVREAIKRLYESK